MVELAPAAGETRWERWSPIGLIVGLVAVHAAGVLWGLGGWAGLRSEWPILAVDHGIHYSHALTSQAMLRESGFTAGYDSNFMAGFPMSVLAGTSFTLVNLTMAFGAILNLPPAPVYKVTVALATIAAPLLVAWGSALLGLSRRGVAWATFFYLLYVWSDFPMSYAGLGMVAFLVAIPTGLVGLGLLVRFLERGGFLAWLGAALGLAATWLAHLSTPLVVAPAGLLAYLAAVVEARRGRQAFPVGRHAGFWLLAPAILLVNVFWWLPGFWLRSTVGETRLMFAHSSESVVGRLAQIFWTSATIETVLIGLGLLGWALLRAARPVAAGALAGLMGAGLAWGYLAGWFPALDSLQPGRQTYALYAGLCLPTAYLMAESGRWLRAARPGRWDRWVSLALVLVLTRISGVSLVAFVNLRLGSGATFLASDPPADLVGLIATVRQHVRPGERLLFEETGRLASGQPDPFGGKHYSPILPERTGVEVIGGPYLYTPLKTNFTQFGVGDLLGADDRVSIRPASALAATLTPSQMFEDPDWGVEQFTRYARIYRPAAIACWSPKARSFCRNHPELVRVVADEGPFTVGRVLGFEGFASRGSAQVETGPNRLVVRDVVPDPSDGRVVLRYHWVPGLVADPPLALEPTLLEADPVPFIALRPKPTDHGPWTIRMVFPIRDSSPPSGGSSAGPAR